MEPKAIEALERRVFYAGTTVYSGVLIPGLEPEKLPIELLDGSTSDGEKLRVTQMQCFTVPEELKDEAEAAPNDQKLRADTRCADCVTAFTTMDSLLTHCQATGHSPVYNPVDTNISCKPATVETFLTYTNTALQQAFSERMARWGRFYIDPKSFTEPRDKFGNNLGVRVFRSYLTEFAVTKPQQGAKPKLTLTVDVRAKLIRTKSVLDALYDGKDPNRYRFTEREIEDLKKAWIGETVISKKEKTCHVVHDLVFEHTPDSMPVGDTGMSHTQYFRDRKQIELEFPRSTPLIAALGRRKSIIFL